MSRRQGRKLKFVIMIVKFDSGGRSGKSRIWFGCECGVRQDLRKYKMLMDIRRVRSVDILSN